MPQKVEEPGGQGFLVNEQGIGFSREDSRHGRLGVGVGIHEPGRLRKVFPHDVQESVALLGIGFYDDVTQHFGKRVCEVMEIEISRYGVRFGKGARLVLERQPNHVFSACGGIRWNRAIGQYGAA